MIRGGRLVGVVATVLAVGGMAIPAFAGAQRTAPALAPHRAGPSAGTESVQLFYTPPVLVRAGERVVVPVDATCITATGEVCRANVTLSALAGHGGWTRARTAASAFRRFDLTAPAARALPTGAGSGSVAFTIEASSAAGTATRMGSERAPLRFYVTRSMPTVRVPAVPLDRVARGGTVVYLPWGSGAHRAGISLGDESPTLGPPSFDVGADGSVSLVDALQGRLAVFSEDGRLTRSVALGRLSPDADVAVSRGATYVLSSDGGGVDRQVRLSAIRPGARAPDRSAPIGRGIPERLDVAGGRPWFRALPLDEWRDGSVAAGGSATVGRPLADGSQLLSVVRGGTVRLAIVRGDRVERAVELAFGADLGELALAETDGHGGYIMVVHVARDLPTPADGYQFVHVVGSRIVRTFAVARMDFARSAALSRFRTGPGGWLYQLTSSPDGVRVLRYRIGGAA